MAAAWIVVPIFLQDTQGTYPRHYHGIVRSLAQQNQAALPVILSNATVDAVAADGGTGNEAAGKRGSAEQKDEDESGGERKRGAQGLVVFTEEEDTMSDVPDEVEPVWWPSDLGVPLAVSPENEVRFCRALLPLRLILSLLFSAMNPPPPFPSRFSWVCIHHLCCVLALDTTAAASIRVQSEAISAASTVAALAGACFSQQRPWGQHSDSPPIFVSYCWANSLEAEETNHIPRGVLCGSDLADPRRLKRLLESHQACMLGDARPCWIDVEVRECSACMCSCAGVASFGAEVVGACVGRTQGKLPSMGCCSLRGTPSQTVRADRNPRCEVAVLCVSTEYAECTRCYQECELAIKRQVDGTGEACVQKVSADCAFSVGDTVDVLVRATAQGCVSCWRWWAATGTGGAEAAWA
eukprot:3358041-Rhodomonas_salina.2